MSPKVLILLAITWLPASVSAQVVTTGKQGAELADVPSEVMAVVIGAHPGFEPREAEYEERDGNAYWDIEGLDARGQEIEFDLTRQAGGWAIVETQRDIAFDAAPTGVREVLSAAHPEFAPHRIIESDQGDGVVIYEFFGPGSDGPETKIEVHYAGGQARVLTEEWKH